MRHHQQGATLSSSPGLLSLQSGSLHWSQVAGFLFIECTWDTTYSADIYIYIGYIYRHPDLEWEHLDVFQWLLCHFSSTMANILGPKGLSEKIRTWCLLMIKEPQKDWFLQTLLLFYFKEHSINYALSKNLSVCIGQITKSEKQLQILALSLCSFCIANCKGI